MQFTKAERTLMLFSCSI